MVQRSGLGKRLSKVLCYRFVGMWKRSVFTYKTLTKWL